MTSTDRRLKKLEQQSASKQMQRFEMVDDFGDGWYRLIDGNWVPKKEFERDCKARGVQLMVVILYQE